MKQIETLKKRQNAVFFSNVFVPWEAETIANSEVFEGQVANKPNLHSLFNPMSTGIEKFQKMNPKTNPKSQKTASGPPHISN